VKVDRQVENMLILKMLEITQLEWQLIYIFECTSPLC